MRYKNQLKRESPEIGDRIKYNGEQAIVTETGLPGEYGTRVAICLSDGTEIITTPKLDHYWNRDRNNPLPTLSELLYGNRSPEMIFAWKKRQQIIQATTPHGQCVNSSICVERAHNKHIKNCKTKIASDS